MCEPHDQKINEAINFNLDVDGNDVSSSKHKKYNKEIRLVASHSRIWKKSTAKIFDNSIRRPNPYRSKYDLIS